MYFIKKRNVLNAFVWIGTSLLCISSNTVQAADIFNIHAAPKELQQFIQQILPAHPRFLAAQAERDSMLASYSASDNAIYNPELELDTEKTDIRTSTVGLSQTIDWGDQRGAKTQIAKHRLDAAQAMFQKERQQLISDLLFVSRDFHNKTRLAMLSSQRLKLMQDFSSLARQKHAAGDLNQVELDLAQLAYSESVLNNAQVITEQIKAEQAYIALYGSNMKSAHDKLTELSIDFDEVALPSDINVFLLTLPQMRIVRANVAASKNMIDLRESESSADPTIAIRGGKEDEESLVGVTLSIPLNIRNNFRAEIDVARKEYLQTELLAQQAWRDLQRDITTQTKHYQLMRKAWLQWKQSGQISMDRQLKLLKRLWRTGDLSTTDYLVQIKQNLDTQSAGIELQTTLWSSWLTWLESTAQIESWLQLNTKRN